MKRKISLVISLFLILFASSAYAQAPSVSVSINPQTQSESLGAPVRFLVTIGNTSGAGISGFDVCVNYDPSYLTVDSVDGPLTMTELKKSIDNQKGVLCSAYVIIVADENLPRGAALTISATGKQIGKTDLSFGPIEVVGSINEEAFEVKTNPGSVTLTSANPPLRTQQPSLLQRIINFFLGIFQ